MSKIMKQDHPLWDQFIGTLEAVIEFDEDKTGNLSHICKCQGNRDLVITPWLLRLIDGVDMRASMAYFKANGAECDCAIYGLDY